MDNPKELATLGTQDTRGRQAKQKKHRGQHNTICVRHLYAFYSLFTTSIN